MSSIVVRFLAASTVASVATFSPVAVNSQALPRISDAVLDAYPVYSGDDLELKVDDAGTHFRLWSPGAENVRLNLYTDGLNGSAYCTVEMKKDLAGTWAYSFPEKLYGKFYTFQICMDGKWLKETPGVWAKAVGTNGYRAAVIDMERTNPEGWEQDKYVVTPNQTDAVVYEVHHRDFSVHANSGIVNKGKFVAMLEPGTVSPDGEKTGIDHLKELGVTHVHILPSYDFNSVDEARLIDRQYNWGCAGRFLFHQSCRPRNPYPRDERDGQGTARCRHRCYYGCGIQPHCRER